MFLDWCQKLCRGQWNVVTEIVTARFHHMRTWVVLEPNDLVMRQERNILLMYVCVFWASVMHKANFIDWRIRSLDFIYHMMHIQPQRKRQFQTAEGMGELWIPHMDACVKISTYQEFFYMLVTKTHLFFQEKKI